MSTADKRPQFGSVNPSDPDFERWEEASIIGRGALRHYPDFGALYAATAHALRNCRGAGEARAVIVGSP